MTSARTAPRSANRAPGDDIVARLAGGDDTFTATTSIGNFEVKGGDGDDLLRGSDVPVKSPGYGTPPSTDYFGDTLIGQQGDDTLIGNQGGDFLTGGGGDDLLIGGPKASDDDNPTDDSFDGGAGDDLILAADHDKDNRIECGRGQARRRRDRQSRPEAEGLREGQGEEIGGASAATRRRRSPSSRIVRQSLRWVAPRPS